MMEEALPSGVPVVSAAVVMPEESPALVQARAQIAEQQEQMRRQAEQSARDQADFKAVVNEKEKELEKARKLVAEAERIRKVQEWSKRILGQSKPSTPGEKENELGEMVKAEG